MPGEIELISAVAQICNKLIPGRKEAAIKELNALEGLLGRALKENNDMCAAQIRARMKQLRTKFADIE
jgi:hypothetical protein